MKIWPISSHSKVQNLFLINVFPGIFCIYVPIPLINHTLNPYKIFQIKTIQKNACTKKHI